MKCFIKIGSFLILVLIGCSKEDTLPQSRVIHFNAAELVTVTGYSDHIMEPFLSRDGTILFFNNSNDPTVDTNLHWAIRIDDLHFDYQGELQNTNTTQLEGVATMDINNNFFFVSTRSYNTDLNSIYTGDYILGSLSSVSAVENLSKKIPGWINFDIEVTADGSQLYFADGRYDVMGGPYEAEIAIAEKSGNIFIRKVDQSILQFINTNDNLEYAAGISSDGLELYFTRVPIPLTIASVTQIFVATRRSVEEPFSLPYKIQQASGFVEAPTISPDGKSIYYHKKINNVFFLYRIKKSG